MRCLLLAALAFGAKLEVGLDPELEAAGAHYVAAGGKAPAGEYGRAVAKRFGKAKAAKSSMPLMDRFDPPIMEETKPEFDAWKADLARFKKEAGFEGFWKEQAPELEKLLAPDRERLLALDPEGKVKAYAGAVYDGRYEISFTPYIEGERMLNSVRPGVVRTVLRLGPDRPHEDYFWNERLPAALWHQLLHGALDKSIEKHLPPRLALTCFGSAVQCAKEHVMRAVLVRMLERERGPEAAQRQRKDGDEDLFPRLPAMEKRLRDEYEKDRKRWPTLESYLPRLLEAL